MSTATENQARTVEFEQVLDLTFLATGDYQHVFVRTGVEDDPWVFKIPAAFGLILPFQQAGRFFWPESVYEKVLYCVSLNLPRGLHKRVARWTGKLRGFTLRLCQAGERSVAVHCRRSRRRHFQRMLSVIELLVDRGLDEILLPHRIIRRATADLHIDGKTVRYEGPMLAQRKAALFEDGVVLPLVHWQQMVEAQHRLWKHGAGVCGCEEMLGTKSWALLGDSVCLADTSALTRNRRTIHNNLDQAMLDKAEARTRSKLRAEDESAALSLANIRREINRERFEELWGTCGSSMKPGSDRPETK